MKIYSLPVRWRAKCAQSKCGFETLDYAREGEAVMEGSEHRDIHGHSVVLYRVILERKNAFFFHGGNQHGEAE